MPPIAVRIVSLLALVALAVGCSSAPRAGKNVGGVDTGFAIRKISFGGDTTKYATYVPDDYQPGKLYPTVLFLHGQFEGGSDGVSPTQVGIGPKLDKLSKKYPMIVIFPQTRGDWRDRKKAPLAMAVLDDAQRRLPIDPDRVVLCGLSTGGYGVWSIGAKYASRFSALVPMCAFLDLDDVPRLLTLPIWAFHNSLDPFVSSGNTMKMTKAINAAGGRAKFTEYGAFGHDCWDRAFGDEDLIKWMLSQRRGASRMASEGATPRSTRG